MFTLKSISSSATIGNSQSNCIYAFEHHASIPLLYLLWRERAFEHNQAIITVGSTDDGIGKVKSEYVHAAPILHNFDESYEEVSQIVQQKI
eukprot:11378661-Ditylum_brightwellii.AAC.1